MTSTSSGPENLVRATAAPQSLTELTFYHTPDYEGAKSLAAMSDEDFDDWARSWVEVESDQGDNTWTPEQRVDFLQWLEKHAVLPAIYRTSREGGTDA